MEIGQCRGQYQRVREGTLTNAYGRTCSDIPLETFDINQFGRFVRFIAKTFYNPNAALQYLYIDFEYPGEVKEILCPGMIKILYYYYYYFFKNILKFNRGDWYDSLAW